MTHHHGCILVEQSILARVTSVDPVRYLDVWLLTEGILGQCASEWDEYISSIGDENSCVIDKGEVNK
jgi:hypothetical protein